MDKVYDIDKTVEKIFDVVLAFNGETKYEKLLDIVLTKMMEITHSDAGTLYILEDSKLHFRNFKNISLNIFCSAEDEGMIDLPPVALDKHNIDSISAYAAHHNKIVVVDDVYKNDSFSFAGPKNYDDITGYRTCSMLVLPLCTHWNENPEVLGVIQLLNATDPETGAIVSYGDIYNPPVIPALANVASNTLANLTHVKEIRMLFHSFVSVMARAVDERSSYSRKHTQNVASICEAFARYISERFPSGHPYHFDENRLDELSMAAMLHDIGKIITPLHIMDKSDRLGSRIHSVRYRFAIKKHQLEIDMLRGRITEKEQQTKLAELESALEFIESVSATGFLKDEQLAKVLKLTEITYRDPDGETVPLLEPEEIEALSVRTGTLTSGERAIMQGHVKFTGRLLDSIAFWKYYKNVPGFARNHHEFLDGTGYPQGLKESDLSIETCIITIADIFEALTASDRPYKKAVTVDKAFETLRKMAEEGKLHKELVKLFIESRTVE